MGTPVRVIHRHDFGPPEARAARMCSYDGCTEWGVCTDGETWSEPTTQQRNEIAVLMFEDVIMADVFRMIHGPDRAGAVPPAPTGTRQGYD